MLLKPFKNMDINAEDKVANFANSNASSDDDYDIHEYIKFNTYCPECNNQILFWCKECNSKRFHQNFGNWTSGNEQEVQSRNIQFLAEDGFSTVYEGIWLDERISHWDYDKQDWKREANELDENNYKDANHRN